MSLLAKIISGDKLRKSRFHDEKGTFCGWKNIFLHAPPAMLSGLLRISVGYQPELPWISYTSTQYLQHFLNKDSRVLEFGSGMSTIWYSRHAKEVFSVEDNRPWYDKVTNFIEKKGLRNIHYTYAKNETEYSTFMSEDKCGFDLVMIDGSYRSKCISTAVKLLKPGGILYLDNSDKGSTSSGGDMRIAESTARSFAQHSNAQVVEITDFAPAQFFVQQGLMIQLPG